jgi:hypothetical protein
MTGRPPAVATWLLNHLATGPHAEAAAGDIVERYQEHGSRFWYWRQVAAAIVTGFLADAWRHAATTIATIAVAIVLPDAYMRFAAHPVNIVYSLWYPPFMNGLTRGAPDPVWHAVIWLRPWEWTQRVAWCLLVYAVARILVSARPRNRGLIVTVLAIALIVECVPYLWESIANWAHDPGNPMWAFNLLWYAVFVLAAVPFSVARGGRPRKQATAG